MHQALLIDEILELILDFCAESCTLSRVGRTCLAWKEPALDRVWWRLLSLKPLLDLIPGLLCVNGVHVLEMPGCPDFRRLRYYASRVKQIVYRQKIQLHPTLLSSIFGDGGVAFTFQKLTTAQLSSANCYMLRSIISSAKGLRRVELDLGFKASTVQTVNQAAFDFLLAVDRVSSCFTSLTLRGIASNEVVISLNSLSRLEVLHLHTGSSLPVESLSAISTFPRLKELEIHIAHIRPEDFEFESSVCFPILELLVIRGHTGSIKKLLRNMQSEALAILRIDISELLPPTDDTWNGLFTTIKEKTRTSLLQLRIEHHMDTQDLPLADNIPSSSGLIGPTINPFVDSPLRTNTNALHFEHLHSLSNHWNLRQIVLDTTPPILVRDQDFEHIIRWWPNLEHLDLGSVSTHDPRWVPKVTLAGLSILSRGLSSFDTLVIPVAIAGMTCESDAAMKLPQNPKNPLRYITLTSLTPPEPRMAQCLHCLFPSLIEIRGTFGHDKHWERVQEDFKLLKLPN